MIEMEPYQRYDSAAPLARVSCKHCHGAVDPDKESQLRHLLVCARVPCEVRERAKAAQTKLVPKGPTNLTGRRFGHWVVQELSRTVTVRAHNAVREVRYWQMQCDCGRTAVVRTCSLLLDRLRACGVCRRQTGPKSGQKKGKKQPKP